MIHSKRSNLRDINGIHVISAGTVQGYELTSDPEKIGRARRLRRSVRRAARGGGHSEHGGAHVDDYGAHGGGHGTHGGRHGAHGSCNGARGGGHGAQGGSHGAHVGSHAGIQNAALAAVVTVGSLSAETPVESVEHAHAVPDHSSFCVEVQVGTVALAAAETVGSVSLTQDHADPVHFKYPDEHVLMLAFA